MGVTPLEARDGYPVGARRRTHRPYPGTQERRRPPSTSFRLTRIVAVAAGYSNTASWLSGIASRSDRMLRLYVVTVSVLKALGDENNPAHWETWTSAKITIARP